MLRNSRLQKCNNKKSLWFFFFLSTNLQQKRRANPRTEPMQISINFRKTQDLVQKSETQPSRWPRKTAQLGTPAAVQALLPAQLRVALGSRNLLPFGTRGAFSSHSCLWRWLGSFFFFFFLMSNVMPIRCSQSDTISFILGWKCDIAKLWFIHTTRRIRVFLSRPSQGGAHRAPRSASKMAFVGQGSSAQQHGGDGALLLGAARQNRSSETFRRFHFSFSIFLLTSFP